MSLIDELLPFVENIKKNRKIEKDIEKISEASTEENIEPELIEKLKDEYRETFHVKDKLEDKAKTNVIGITISITLIMGSSGIMTALGKKYPSSVLSWVLFVVITLSIVYMLLAGILAIKVLIDENVVYKVNTLELTADEQEENREYKKYIILNQKRNLIRNNYVYSSYGCIRNSLICLFVIFILLIIPLKSKGQDSCLIYVSSTYSIMYSSESMDYIKDIDSRDSIESRIIEDVISSDNKTDCYSKGVIFDDEKLFVKYELKDNTINIIRIEPYENVIECE